MPEAGGTSEIADYLLIPVGARRCGIYAQESQFCVSLASREALPTKFWTASFVPCWRVRVILVFNSESLFPGAAIDPSGRRLYLFTSSRLGSVSLENSSRVAAPLPAAARSRRTAQ